MNEVQVKKLALAIVSYNSAQDLPLCLESLLAEITQYPSYVQNVKVVVVENGTDSSSQQVVEQILQANSDAKDVLSWQAAPENFGYAGGVNFGWEVAGQADIYIALNPDMRFCAGWLAHLIAPFERDAKIGVVGCKLLTANAKIQHAGGLVTHGAALGLHFGAGAADDGRWDAGAEVEFVTGAALAMPAAVRQKTNGFDAKFFPGYYEDVDLCARVRHLGFKVWYEPAAVAYHYEGGSFGRSSNYYRAFHRNRLRYVLKNFAAARLLYDFVPAERARLRGMLAPIDRRASEAVYNAAKQTQFSKIATEDGDGSLKDVLGNYDTNTEVENAPLEQLENQLAEVKQHWKVEEKAFRSSLPFVASLREKFNSISTKWYVRPILQQQVDYNGAVARSLETLGQLVAGRDVASDMQYSVLASRLTTLENRLDRIESLLERLLERQES